jgi:hypothetical protein
MSPSPRSVPSRLARGLAVGTLIAGLGVVGALWASHRHASAAASAVSAREPAGTASSGDDAAAAIAAASPASASAPTPGHLSAAQWRVISERIEPGPDHDRELARIASLMAFQDNVARLRALRGDPGAADERRRLAREIDAGIELHLARREATGPDALQLKAAVLAEIEPDVAARAAQLEAFRQGLEAANPPARDPRVVAYQRQEAAIVAEWQSGPASRRDPAELARRLQQLQVAVFDRGP